MTLGVIVVALRALEQQVDEHEITPSLSSRSTMTTARYGIVRVPTLIAVMIGAVI